MARVISESRLHERRRRARNVRIGIICALALLFLAGLVALSRAPFMRITSVVVSGVRDELIPTVQADVEFKISGAYLGLFARNNILLYPKSALAGALLQEFPEFKTVSIHANPPAGGFHTIDVVVVERQPAALWCSQNQDVASSSPCFSIDENGLVYASASSSQSYIAFMGGSPSQNLPWHYLTPAQFKSLFAFVAALGAKVPGDSVARVLVDEVGDAHVFFASGFELRFALSSDAGEVLEHFDLAQSSSIFKAHPLSDFLYLDLRFGDKLYYKLRSVDTNKK